MKQVISTSRGEVLLVPPTVEILRGVRKFMPLGVVRYTQAQQSADYGLVMRCGEKEAHAIKQQPPDCDEKDARLMFRANSILIAHSLAGYLKNGFGGLLMPCTYMRKKHGRSRESGICYFGGPSPKGKECLDRPFEPGFDGQFGHGFTAMFMGFTESLKASADLTHVPLFTTIGLDVRPRSNLETVGFSFMVLGQDVIALKTEVIDQDPAWTVLADVGIKRVYHMPSLPAAIQESELHIAKALDEDEGELEDGIPDKLRPSLGCRLLVREENDAVYEMPIRALKPETLALIRDRSDPRAWYEMVESAALTNGQRIACLQRAVLLDPKDPGWWYTLGCHYELEGKDWYGATNAFNHVVFFDPRSSAAWFSLGQLWASRGFMSKAQECQREFERLTGTPPCT
jgi:hypothetical protein